MATAQTSYGAVKVPVIEGYEATPNKVETHYPGVTTGELKDMTIKVIYKKKAIDDGETGGTITQGNPDVTQPTTNQSIVTQPETEQLTVAEPSGEVTPETEQSEIEQPAEGVETAGDGTETPETEAVSSTGAVKDDTEAAGQAIDSQNNDGQPVASGAQQLPQTDERDGQTGSVM